MEAGHTSLLYLVVYLGFILSFSSDLKSRFGAVKSHDCLHQNKCQYRLFIPSIFGHCPYECDALYIEICSSIQFNDIKKKKKNTLTKGS